MNTRDALQSILPVQYLRTASGETYVVRYAYGTTEERLKAAAARVHRNPTEAQAVAGNARRGHVYIQGLHVTIETPRGLRRWPGGPVLSAHYGYIRRTKAADGEQVDILIGPAPGNPLVYAMDFEHRSGRYSETKIFLGFRTRQEALTAFKQCWPPGTRIGPVVSLTIQQLKAWLAEGDTTKRIAGQKIKL